MKDKMFRLALRITLNRAEAEDVTQDILLRVWEQRESLGELRSLEAYVLTAVRNLALDRVAKTDNANVSLDDVQTDAFDSAPRPDEDMEQQESLKRVREIMSGLPEAQRTALQLREIEGHSYRETADIMNVSEANVKVLIFRARQAVKNKINTLNNCLNAIGNAKRHRRRRMFSAPSSPSLTFPPIWPATKRCSCMNSSKRLTASEKISMSVSANWLVWTRKRKRNRQWCVPSASRLQRVCGRSIGPLPFWQWCS